MTTHEHDEVKEPGRIRRLWRRPNARAAIVGVVAFTIGAGMGGADSEEALRVGVADPSATEESVREEPPETTAPAATWRGTCSYVLGDFSAHTDTGYAFVAQGDVENEGSGTVTVEVVASWDQIGTDPITETQTVKVAEGASVTVKFNRPVGQREISRIQELPTDQQCSVEPTIVYVDTSRRP